MPGAGVGLPFFLRESDKVPPPPPPPPLPRRSNRIRWRSFELAVSLEALLQIKDAADLLFNFICDRPESDDDIGNGEYRNVVWFFEGIYMVDSADWRNVVSLFFLKLAGGPRSKKTQDLIFSIYKMPFEEEAEDQTSANVSSAPSLLDTNIARLMDILFQLLAKHEAISEIYIDHQEAPGLNPNTPLPVSLQALKAFVSEAESPRTLCLDAAGLTADQWRVVAFNCNPSVMLFCNKLHIDLTRRGEFDVLLDAMKCSKCPTTLRFNQIHLMPTDAFQEFVDVLGSTTSLKGLEITAFSESRSTMISLCEAIARNHGLLKLMLSGYAFPNSGSMTLSDTGWEIFCHYLASHPTLNSLHICLKYASLSEERDQIMIRYISNNPVLCTFTSDEHCSHNYDNVLQTVRPFLELNRVRPVLKAIKQQMDHETDVCHKLFTVALLSDYVSKRPACRFWLLKENANTLAEQLSHHHHPVGQHEERSVIVARGGVLATI